MTGDGGPRHVGGQQEVVVQRAMEEPLQLLRSESQCNTPVEGDPALVKVPTQGLYTVVQPARLCELRIIRHTLHGLRFPSSGVWSEQSNLPPHSTPSVLPATRSRTTSIAGVKTSAQ